MNAQFLAGAASGSIMPERDMIDNSIHSCMTVRFDEPGSPLRAKALALSFGERWLILIALDLAVLKNAHVDHIRAAVAEELGLDPKDIVLNCSHSHSTPFAEPLDRPHPFLDLITGRCIETAKEAWASRQPARFGHGVTHVVGASFNTRVPLPDGRVKFTRDFREGLASGRPIDPRLSVVRIDDADGRPIAGWVRFAAHPACVIFDAPVSAEYPGYMTEQLEKTVSRGAPVLFGFGSSGDVNCVPMFGTEADSQRLGLNLANLVAETFESIRTKPPHRMAVVSGEVDLPLDPPPDPQTLEREIAEVERFIADLDRDPRLEWVLGVNCKKDWPVEKKKSHARPLAEWARQVRQALADGWAFPTSWPRRITSIVVDDLGLVFASGEPFVELGLDLAARSPLADTLLMAMGNGADGYLGTDEDRRRGGYEMYTLVRYYSLGDDHRPLPYAQGAGEKFVQGCLDLIEACRKR